MPASSAEVIGAALTSAFTARDNKRVEDQLVASSKQVLLNHVEFDRAGNQQSMVLAGLKTKYVSLSSSSSSANSSSPAGPSMATAHSKKEDQLEEPRVVLWPRDKVVLGWRKTFPPGAGMLNLGNTCYMNSSLQALFHIPAMANWLLDDLASHTARCQNTPTSASYCSICAMMNTLRQTLDRSNTVIKPALIHHKLKNIGKTLMYGRQEDAHEFIKLLLDHMEKSYLLFKRATKLDHRSKETTPLNQIFGGYIRQQVICPLCRHVSTTFSHFQDLVLDIRSVSSVDEALNLHFRKETLDSENAYKCEKCHKRVSATKRHLIERAPHVLLIQLKRFTFNGGKISKHINIQRTIDVSRFVNGRQQQPGHYQYRLASMVIHIGGSQHGGHYTAVAEASNGTMFEFDDSSVRSISVQSALLRNPYILFYEMVRKPKDPQALKQVVRQSSEKTLIRQNSDGVAKPIPTSHSASSVANGYGHENGFAAKTPLPTHKEREKIVIGLKMNGAKSDSSTSPAKPNKIILKPGTQSLLGSKNTNSLPAKSSSPLVKNPVNTNSLPSKSSSPLVKNPVNTNSLPSKSSQGSSPKGSVSSNSLPSKSSVGSGSVVSKSSVNSNSSKNSLSSLSNSSSSSSSKAPGYKGLSSLVPYPDDSEESEPDESRRVNGHAVNGRPSENGKLNGVKCGKAEKVNGREGEARKGLMAPFLPRALQVTTEETKGQGWTVSDAALHSPSEGSSSSSSGSHAAFTVVEQPTAAVPEKPLHHGWTVTVRRQRPELEKSHSHDSVLPPRRHDEPDSASLRSKTSVDSTRSDRSTKSMKKSIFSLFTCVSAARSPDSPEDDQPEALPPTAEEPRPTNGQAKLAEPEDDLSNDSSSSQNPGSARASSDGRHHDDNDGGKRLRDGDDAEPASPSKKCRPELNGATKNGSVCNGAKNGVSHDAEHNRNTVPSNGHRNGVENQPSKNGFVDGGREKKSKRSGSEGKSAVNGVERETTSTSSLSPSSDSESSEDEKEEGTKCWQDNKEKIGYAKTNPDAHVVQWSAHLKDLSHTLPGREEPKKTSVKGMWDMDRDTNVVDELRKAGSFAFGTKVNSWSGVRGAVDAAFERDRHESRKRTADDLYNEEFDRGRTKKVKKKAWDAPRWNATSPNNQFQKVQDARNNPAWNNNTNGHNYTNGNTNGHSYTNGNGHSNYTNGNNHVTNGNFQNGNGNQYQRNGYYNNHNNRYNNNNRNNNNKPWNKFQRREHNKYHKKHKERYRHWDRRD